MRQSVYIVFDRYDSMFAYDGIEEKLDDVYQNETDAKKRVDELNRGKMKSEPMAYHIETELKGGSK